MPPLMKLSVVLAASSVLVACTVPTPQTDPAPSAESAYNPQVQNWDSVSLRLSRGICFGACPSYIVEIKGDGTVNYCGRNFVKEIGKREDSLPQSEVKALFKKFKTAKFESLDDSYRARVTDLPSYTLRMAYDDTVKTVTDYGGDMIDMPAIVTELEQDIDETANTAQWIGKAEEKQRANRRVECAAEFEPQ